MSKLFRHEESITLRYLGLGSSLAIVGYMIVIIAQKIYNNVINGVNEKDVSVVLMHDAYDKHTTLEALPMILEKLQAMNALILPITEDTVPVHHNF